jgi:hypothetical protein
MSPRCYYFDFHFIITLGYLLRQRLVTRRHLRYVRNAQQ